MMSNLRLSFFILVLFPVLTFADADSEFLYTDLLDNDFLTQATPKPGGFKVINPFAPIKETGGLFFNAGGRIDPNIAIVRCGIFRTFNGWFSFLVGLEALSDDDDHTFGGLTTGFRVKFPFFITPFVGIHLFAGTYEEEVDADNDGKDNDDDGAIDEANEKKWETSDTMVATCPEIGLMVFMDKNSRIVFSARHYFTDKGRESDYWIYSVGINIVF